MSSSNRFHRTNNLPTVADARFKRRNNNASSSLPPAPALNDKSIVVTRKRNNGNGNGQLTANEKIFADEWLIDRNGTRAYKVAYPNTKSDSAAAVGAHHKLRIGKIKKYIAARLAEMGIKAEMTQEWVLERYKKLTEYHLDDFYDDEGQLKPLSEIPEGALYAVCGFKNMKRNVTQKGRDGSSMISKTTLQNLKLPDKKDVLDSIAKYLGMQGPQGGSSQPIVPIQINVTLID